MSFAGNFLRGLGKLAPGMMGKNKKQANVQAVVTEIDPDSGREYVVSRTYDGDPKIKNTDRVADKIEHIRHNMMKEFHGDTYATKSGKSYDNPWARTAHVHSENCEHNHTRYNCDMPNCSIHGNKSPELNYAMNLGSGYGSNNHAMSYGRGNIRVGTGTRIRAGVHDPYDISQSGKGAFDHLSSNVLENKLRYGSIKKSRSRKKDIPSYGMGF